MNLAGQLQERSICWTHQENELQYRHQEFKFPLLDATHCGTEAEHKVSKAALSDCFSLFILSPFYKNIGT